MASASRELDGMAFLLVGPEPWQTRIEPALAGASTSTVTTIEAAIDRYRSTAFDGLLVAYKLPDGTAIDLLDAVRAAPTTLPVIVCPEDGNEAIASAAIGAGATDYIPIGSDPNEADSDGSDSDEADSDGSDSNGRQPSEPMAARILRAVNASRREVTRRDRARQFDSIFRKRQAATWVLDPDGALVRANRTARELAAATIESIVGEPFWELHEWGPTDRTRSSVRDVIRRAAERGSVERFVTEIRPGGREDVRMIELSVFPVENVRAETVSIVVEGDDVTERVSLYRELRQSEELHRVTLNNMTDTVLVTDDDGRFTYVCPNVHFIFGYTVEEIYEFETIDRLLGEELFDREQLTERGVLTNIETTATDSAGNEHTLLVNVREVDIQGGTLLFSCRDVTKRKQREEALTALQRTTRNLLYADSKGEIAGTLIAESEEIVGLSARAIYLYDPGENALEPTAFSDPMEELHGPLRPIVADDETLVGHSFIEGEPAFYGDVRTVDRIENRASGLRSVAYVPIGNHGVLVVGSPEPDRFDAIAREITDLLAATAEAAMDRIEREDRLRTQDRTVQRQNEQLRRLNEINELIREIDRAIVRAETREEIDRTVCAALTEGSQFSFAWIGELDREDDRLDPKAWAGDGDGYLDELRSMGYPSTGDASRADRRAERSAEERATGISAALEPSQRTALTGETTVVTNVGENLRAADWQKHALRRGYQSVIAVPIVYEGFVYGVLAVYADVPDAFDETARAVLEELGETIASAISGLNRKNALLTSSGTRVTFEIDDPEFVLTRLARAAECSIAFEGRTRRTADGDGILVSVETPAAGRVVSAAREVLAVDDVRILADGETTATIQLQLTERFIAGSLADHGAVLERVETDGTTATVTIVVPANVESRPIIQHVTSSFEGVELVAKYDDDRPTSHELYSTFLDRLTDRQLEVLQAAYYGGFFESPREQTGEEIAAALDISPPAFYQHIRRIQRKLFSTLFEEIGLRQAESAGADDDRPGV